MELLLQLIAFMNERITSSNNNFLLISAYIKEVAHA